MGPPPSAASYTQDEKEEDITSDENKDNAEDQHQHQAVTIQAAFQDLLNAYNRRNAEEKEEEATTTTASAATIIIDEEFRLATTSTKHRSTSISTELTLDTIHEEEEEEYGEDE